MLDFIKSVYLIILKAASFGLALFLVFYFAFSQYKNWEMQKNYIPYPFVDDGICSVAVIPISGELGISDTNKIYDAGGQLVSSITPYGDIDRIISDLDVAKNNPNIKAVVLQIDSYGGSPIAPEIFLKYVENYNKPIVSVIREAGDSAAYAIAIGTDHIIAGETSSVGSIGSNASFINNSDKNKKDGLNYISITTGKYKDIGVPDKELSKEDIAFLKDQNNSYGQIFKNWVAKYRNMTPEKVDELATGQAWTGKEAKNLGLIDEVGSIQNALDYLTTKLLLTEKVTACQTNKL